MYRCPNHAWVTIQSEVLYILLLNKKKVIIFLRSKNPNKINTLPEKRILKILEYYSVLYLQNIELETTCTHTSEGTRSNCDLLCAVWPTDAVPWPPHRQRSSTGSLGILQRDWSKCIWYINECLGDCTVSEAELNHQPPAYISAAMQISLHMSRTCSKICRFHVWHCGHVYKMYLNSKLEISSVITVCHISHFPCSVCLQRSRSGYYNQTKSN
jgi:hypothetical protein